MRKYALIKEYFIVIFILINMSVLTYAATDTVSYTWQGNNHKVLSDKGWEIWWYTGNNPVVQRYDIGGGDWHSSVHTGKITFYDSSYTNFINYHMNGFDKWDNEIDSSTVAQYNGSYDYDAKYSESAMDGMMALIYVTSFPDRMIVQLSWHRTSTDGIRHSFQWDFDNTIGPEDMACKQYDGDSWGSCARNGKEYFKTLKSDTTEYFGVVMHDISGSLYKCSGGSQRCPNSYNTTYNVYMFSYEWDHSTWSSATSDDEVWLFYWSDNGDETSHFFDIADDYTSPDSLVMSVGTLVTSDKGDLDSDGFNEGRGWYTVQASSNTAQFDLDGSSVTRVNPIFKITSYTAATAPTITFGTTTLVNGTNANIHIDTVNDIMYIQYFADVSADITVTIGDVNDAPSSSTISESSTSASPTNVGSDVTFSGTISDPDSADQVRLAICKTDAISGTGTCTGGAWCYDPGSATYQAEGAASCSYTTLVGDSTTNAWYAFACDDDNACTGMTESDGTFHVNHRPATGASSSDADSAPGKSTGQAITFTMPFTDSDSDTAKIHVCKTDSMTGTSCTGGSWCDGSTFGTSSRTCQYTVQAGDGPTENYYVFACDSHDFCDATSDSGTFYANSITYGTLSTTILSPTTSSFNSTVNETFTFQVRITCTGGDCGNVQVTLDPKQKEEIMRSLGIKGNSYDYDKKINNPYQR